MPPVNNHLVWLIIGTFAALSIGTTVRMLTLRTYPADVVQQRMSSLKIWWLLATLCLTAAVFGKIGATILFAVASGLALREYFRLVGAFHTIGRAAIACVVGCGIIHYGLIVASAKLGESDDIAKWFLPITLLLLLSAIRATTATSAQYMRITASLYWGAMLMIYGLSHSLFLYDLDPLPEPHVGPAGWFLFLVLLTEMNDIMQAVVGRKFGKHKVTPDVSPNKSLEGLLGGLVTTVVLSVLLAPYLTTFCSGRNLLSGIGWAAIAGILISLAGFLGDINMSAIKRDANVKDGSRLLPGMGGVIDRIDSLIFTGPVFYYFVGIANYLSPQATGV
jgi:phosphatidate cytidylyltransferase